MSDNTTNRSTAANRPPRTAVLVAVHGDGFLEVYAEPSVDVRIESVPYCPTERGERLALEVFERLLPWRYRNLYWPGKLRAYAKLKRRLPTAMLRAEHELALLRALDKLRPTPPADRRQRAAHGKGGRKWTP